MRKKLVWLVVLVLLLGTMFGCQSSTGTESTMGTTTSKATSTTTGTTTAGTTSEEAPLEIYWMGFTDVSGTPFFAEDWITSIVEEKFNVKIKKAAVDWTSQEKMGIFFAEGERPDVMMTRMNTTAMIREGLIRSFPVEWLYNYMPDWMDAVESTYDSEIIRAQVTRGGDEAWGIPSMIEAYYYGFNTMYNMTWANSLGISETPQTLDDLYDYCYKVTFGDPDGNGTNDTYGISGSGTYFEWGTLSYIFFYNNTYPNSYYLQDNGSVISNVQMDAYKEALKTLAKWYDDGIIFPEFVTAKYRDTVMSGIIGTYTHRASVNHNDLVDLKKATESEWEIGVGFRDRTGALVTSNTYPDFLRFFPVYFGANASDEIVERAMEIINYVGAIKEGVLLSRFLSYGDVVRYNLSEEGVYTYGDDWKALDATGRAELGSGFLASIASQVIPVLEIPRQITANLEWMSSMKKVYKGQNFSIAATADYGTVGEVIQALGPDCATIQNNYAVNVILGDVDVDSTYDAFVAEWLKAGGENILAELSKLAIKD